MKNLHIVYDEEGDLMYVRFVEKPTGPSVSLNDRIVVTYDPVTRQGQGITLIGVKDLLPLPGGEAHPLALRADLRVARAPA